MKTIKIEVFNLRNSMIQAGFSEEAANVVMSRVHKTFYNDERYDCADNIRIARQSCQDEVMNYEDAKNHGCCGFFDEEVQTPDGVVMLGFNYGH